MDTTSWIEVLALALSALAVAGSLLYSNYRLTHNHLKTLEANQRETNQRLDDTNQKIDDNYKDLVGKIDTLRVELTQRMDAGFSEIRGVLWTLVRERRNPDEPLALPEPPAA